MKETLCNLLDNPPRDPLGYINIGVLADHLLENGVLVPKYKIGQVFWWSSVLYKQILKVKLHTIRYNTSGFCYVMKTPRGEFVGFVKEDFGVRVHTTEADAKAAIREWKQEKTNNETLH